MGRKSFSNLPVEEKKIDLPPEQPAEEKPLKRAAKPKMIKAQIIPGSLTIWSQRYEGVVVWPEGDKRIEAAGKDLRIIEIIEG